MSPVPDRRFPRVARKPLVSLHPPLTSTRPSASRVAAWPRRSTLIKPAGDQVSAVVTPLKAPNDNKASIGNTADLRVGHERLE